MAIPPPLLFHLGVGANVQVYRVTGGSTAVQFGNNVAGATPYTSAPQDNIPTNHVAIWGKGATEPELWLWHGDDTYKYNNGTSNWDAQSLALPVIALNGQRNHSGLYEIQTASGPRLIGIYVGTGVNEMRYIVYDGTSWTDATLGNVGISTTGSMLGIVYRNVLFQVFSNETGAWAFDLSGPTVSQYVFGTTDYPYAFCVWNGELWCLTARTTSFGGIDLYKFTGSGFTSQKSNIGASYNGATGSIRMDDAAAAALHVDPATGNLVAAFAGEDTTSGNAGIFCFDYDYATLTETDRTTTDVPAAIRANAVGGNDQDRILCTVDNSTDPLNPAVHYYFQPRLPGPWTGSWTSYSSNGLGTLWTNNGGGLNGEFSFPQESEGGGSRIFTTGQPWVQIQTPFTPVTGGERMSFYCGGGGTREVRFIFNEREEFPDTLATLLAGTATGGSATNTTQKVQNVTADGVTLYTVDRDVNTDPVSTGSKETIMAEIDTTLP